MEEVTVNRSHQGRPSVVTVATTTSASYLPEQELAVTVHGRAELFDVADPHRSVLREAMLEHYLPLQGPDFELWLDAANPIGARISADKLFTFVVTR